MWTVVEGQSLGIGLDTPEIPAYVIVNEYDEIVFWTMLEIDKNKLLKIANMHNKSIRNDYVYKAGDIVFSQDSFEYYELIDNTETVDEVGKLHIYRVNKNKEKFLLICKDEDREDKKSERIHFKN